MKKNDITEFLSSLEGYHQALKMLHWSTTNKAEHLLADEMDGKVLEFQDRIAEVSMGLLDTRFGFGDLRTLLPESRTCEGIIDELASDIRSLRLKVDNSEDSNGLSNVIDDFTEAVNSWNYLKTLS